MSPTEYQQLIEVLGQRFTEIDREIIERDLAELERYAAALQARIEEIEQRLGN